MLAISCSSSSLSFTKSASFMVAKNALNFVMRRAQVNIENFEFGLLEQLRQRCTRHFIAGGEAAENKRIRFGHARQGGRLHFDAVHAQG